MARAPRRSARAWPRARPRRTRAPARARATRVAVRPTFAGRRRANRPQPSFRQETHRTLEPLQGQRKHAVADELLDQRDALPVLPDALRFGVDPAVLGERVREALDPFGAGLGVVVFDAAARLQDLVRTHRGVADEDQPVVLVVLADHVPGGVLL